jgi:hypothetical protein
LHIATPNGGLDLTGKINWPDLLPDSRLTDVLQHMQAKALLRVAIPLATRLSQAMIDLTYTNDSQPEPAPVVAEKKISAAERQNEIMIAMMMESHQLLPKAGASLLAQQKNQASLDDYQLVLDALVASKQIDQAASETLRAKYAAIQWVTMGPDQRRENALKVLQKRIAQWVQDGFITEDKTDYISTITFQGGEVSVNGKVVEQVF